jgi:hypothetical protein
VALSYAFASSMKAAVPIAALRHPEIRQPLDIERDCLLTNVPIRSSDIIILDDWEVHIPEYAFKLDDVLVLPESRGCAPDQLSRSAQVAAAHHVCRAAWICQHESVG